MDFYTSVLQIQKKHGFDNLMTFATQVVPWVALTLFFLPASTTQGSTLIACNTWLLVLKTCKYEWRFRVLIQWLWLFIQKNWLLQAVINSYSIHNNKLTFIYKFVSLKI